MGFLKFTTLALLSLQVFSVVAKDEFDNDITLEENIAPPVTPELDVKVTTTFPQSEIFGVKLINGHATQAVLSVENNELEPITVEIIGGQLVDERFEQVVRNLSATRYGLEVPAGAKESLTYSFATELHPQDLRLQIVAVLAQDKQGVFTVAAYNQTVSIVEAPVSIFDPQIIFLYLVLASLFGGTIYFIYSTWFTTFFPKKRGRASDKGRRPVAGSKRSDFGEPATVTPAEGPVITTGAKTYDESWIPAGHLQRPEARRVGSGRPSTPKTKARQA